MTNLIESNPDIEVFFNRFDDLVWLVQQKLDEHTKEANQYYDKISHYFHSKYCYWEAPSWEAYFLYSFAQCLYRQEWFDYLTDPTLNQG